jgi:hypothetical protein
MDAMLRKDEIGKLLPDAGIGGTETYALLGLPQGNLS